MASVNVVYVDLGAVPKRQPPPANAQPTKGILKKSAPSSPSTQAQSHSSVQPASQIRQTDQLHSHQASASRPGQPHQLAGALSPRGLVWDEANLEETSRERGTRMKIEEVETPYAWPGDYSIDPSDSERSDDDEGEGDEEAAPRSRAVDAMDVERSSVASPSIGDALHAKLGAVKRKQEAGADLASHPEHVQAEKEDFKRRRKQHYDEGKAWKQLKQGAQQSRLQKRD